LDVGAMTSPSVLTMLPPVAPVDVPALAAPKLRALGILTPDEAARLDAIERASWCLVKMDQGEYWRCGRCGCVHKVTGVGPVLTYYCVPFPCRGIREALAAHYKHAGARSGDLSPRQRLGIEEVLGDDETPELADHHPDLARRLHTPERDVEYVGLVLGTVEPISPEDARRYASLINARAHRTVVKP
jgi:hypothetical protein